MSELKKYDVAIVTGWSDVGGSTESYINLTNALNDDGVSTVMLGGHSYHLDKCDSGTLNDFVKVDAKNIIWHFMDLPRGIQEQISNKNLILSCHEHELNRIFYRYVRGMFDHFHFVSDSQKQWHLKTDGIEDADNMHVIPNLLDPSLNKYGTRPSKKIGGVIGSIDRNKQTHVSIMQALKDGCEVVRVFGKDTDQEYHLEYVCPLLKDPRVMYHGVIDDKNKMYSSITDVYHYSVNETWGYIKAECKYLGIPFHSNNETPLDLKSTQDIINSWKGILK